MIMRLEEAATTVSLATKTRKYLLLESALQLLSCCPIFTSRLAAINDTEAFCQLVISLKESRAVDLKSILLMRYVE